MKKIAFIQENAPGELRCSITPNNVKSLIKMGADVMVESNLGINIGYCDDQYYQAGAIIYNEREKLLRDGDLIISINRIPEKDIASAKGSTVISFLDPFNSTEYLHLLNKFQVTALSVEMIPRTSYCQKMDALSSQASLSGYVMTMLAFNNLNRIAPMMMTPSGTIKPAKVFVIGAGVAGLQAIATAKRLGAQVTAFDTRSVVEDQVRSLGAKFLKIDLGDTGQTTQGYATALTQEQLNKQQDAQAQCIADSDVVITTAQLFGRKPPLLIKKEALLKMKPGSIVVDMAAESGGNVEGSIPQQVTTIGQVKVIGTGNWSNQVPKDASQMYANNIQHLLSEFWCHDSNSFVPDESSEIWQSCCITDAGNIVNQQVENTLTKEAS